MTDIYDQASIREMNDREFAIARQRARPVPKAAAKGSCHNCGENFEEDSQKLYCDGKCADQHAQRQSGRRY